MLQHNITNDEKNKAKNALSECKKRERKRKLIPVQMNDRTWVMMSPRATKQQIEEKRKKYST